MSTKEIVEKILLGFIGLTLSVIAFLIKWQLSEMNDTIKTLGTAMQQVQIESAVMNKEVQLHRDWLQSYQGRLSYVEARVERFNTLLEKK